MQPTRIIIVIRNKRLIEWNKNMTSISGQRKYQAVDNNFLQRDPLKNPMIRRTDRDELSIPSTRTAGRETENMERESGESTSTR